MLILNCPVVPTCPFSPNIVCLVSLVEMLLEIGLVLFTVNPTEAQEPPTK